MSNELSPCEEIEGFSMGIVFLIVVGGLLGWLASIVLRVEEQSEVLLNVGAGVAGALTAGLVVNPLLGGGSLVEDTYSVGALLIALLGSIACLAFVNVYRRQAAHR